MKIGEIGLTHVCCQYYDRGNWFDPRVLPVLREGKCQKLPNTLLETLLTLTLTSTPTLPIKLSTLPIKICPEKIRRFSFAVEKLVDDIKACIKIFPTSPYFVLDANPDVLSRLLDPTHEAARVAGTGNVSGTHPEHMTHETGAQHDNTCTAVVVPL